MEINNYSSDYLYRNSQNAYYNLVDNQKNENINTSNNFDVDKNQNKIVEPKNRIETLSVVFDESALKRMGIIECETCSSRTYKDESDDSSVSFQAPTKLSPAQARTAVISHEMEHVAHERLNAQKEDKTITSQTVQIFHSTCPECGRTYVSGGLTTTKTMGSSEGNSYKDVISNENQSQTGILLDLAL